MKKIAFSLIFLALAAQVFAQAEAKPYTLKGQNGEIVISGFTLDQVWSKIIKLFMTQNVKGGTFKVPPVRPDRPSDTINGVLIMGKGLTAWPADLTLLLEEVEGGVKIYSSASSEKPAGKRNLAKVNAKFFDMLLEALKAE